MTSNPSQSHRATEPRADWLLPQAGYLLASITQVFRGGMDSIQKKFASQKENIYLKKKLDEFYSEASRTGAPRPRQLVDISSNAYALFFSAS